MKMNASTISIYFTELAAFYGFAFFSTHSFEPEIALFQAGLALFFVICACLVARPAAPHVLLRLMGRPMSVLMSVVVMGFGIFGGGQAHFADIVPAFGLCLLGAAFADRIDRSRKNPDRKK